MTDLSYIAFFGDGEHTFRLTKREIEELQVKCGSGIGAIANRLFARNFAQADINETIRLALIGGGMTPKRAHELIATYVEGRPLIETYELAAKILERTLCGNPNEKETSK
ncbi:gene transfer agent family protein [Bradyrhizobium sp. CCBAU 53351]|uniref:gene transfer agent family protein n=1 Tax=Bradyrhizobium sp. CCBAU 53351 TaxID=1325114 RepID=UPI0018871FEE|nr:gene transfer agent family protein [Bradyrhizobium sp. CCBAU 53351]QOZ76724.1 gene transfer agent family protein [Bradyrhizobium sp. CCBAU 53351]